MANWTFYSPKCPMVTAGELLRAIPSTRNWRLERSVSDDDEESQEPVRAAEQLMELDVTLRLQNEPAAATRLQVRTPTADDRARFGGLGHTSFSAKELAIVADVTLDPAAREAGHLDIVDDVIAGLEGVYRRGVAHCADNGELVVGAELVRLLDSDTARCSHIDVRLCGATHVLDYLGRQFAELPPPFGQLTQRTSEAVMLRARFPLGLADEEINAVCSVALAMSRHATDGHVRFRERGVWRDAVPNVSASVQPLPTDQSEGMFGRLTKLLRARKN